MMTKSKFLLVFLAVMFSRISCSFPFDLSKILDPDEKYPNFINISGDYKNSRTIGSYPTEEEASSFLTSASAAALIEPSKSVDTFVHTRCTSADSSVFPTILADAAKVVGLTDSIDRNVSTSTSDGLISNPSLKKMAAGPPSSLCPPNLLNATSSCDAPTPKRRRNTRAITSDMTVDEIIELEVANSGYIKEGKRQQFRKTLQIIAQNDGQAFIDDENNFKAMFGSLYGSFKKDGCSMYLTRFIIMFGAYNVVFNPSSSYFCNRPSISDESHRIIEAVNYLLKTKPFEVFMKLFLSHFLFDIEKNTYDKIIKAVKDKYPDLPFFKNLFVESLNTKSSYQSKIFMEDDDKTAFVLVIDRLSNFCWRSDVIGMKLHTAALQFPDFYLELNDKDKFMFVSAFIESDDVENFEKIIELYPDIMMYFEDFESIYRGTCNILSTAVHAKALKCIKFICEIAPELITASSPTIRPALELIFEEMNPRIVSIINDLGYTDPFIPIIVDGMEFNLIHWAFYVHSSVILKFCISVLGSEIVKNEIRTKWKTVDQILIHLLNFESEITNFDFKDYIIKLFLIDVNANYRYKDFEGNASIFLDKQFKPRTCLDIPYLNFDAPVYWIDSVTGTRTLIKQT